MNGSGNGWTRRFNPASEEPVNPLYSHTLGSGPDVVLLHGWGMHSGVWEDVVEALLDHHRVTVLDLPGHGYSRAFGSVIPWTNWLRRSLAVGSAPRGLGRLVAGRAGRATGGVHRPGAGQPAGAGQQHALFRPASRLAARRRSVGAAPLRRGIAPGLSRRPQALHRPGSPRQRTRQRSVAPAQGDAVPARRAGRDGAGGRAGDSGNRRPARRPAPHHLPDPAADGPARPIDAGGGGRGAAGSCCRTPGCTFSLAPVMRRFSPTCRLSWRELRAFLDA